MLPNVVRNGRTVWQQIGSDNYIFYDHNRFWLVGDDYNENLGRICSIRPNLNLLPVQGWEYVSDSWVWEIAHDLRFEPVRPLIGTETCEQVKETRRSSSCLWRKPSQLPLELHHLRLGLFHPYYTL